VSSKRKFWILVAVVTVLAGLLLAASWTTIVRERHHLAGWLVEQGSGQTGATQLAWYDLAHTASPGDPAVGLSLSQAQILHNSPGSAEATLKAYPDYWPAAVLRAQLLLHRQDYVGAQQALRAVSGRSAQVAYWQAVALAEQGSLAQAQTVLAGSTATDNVLLEQLLRLAVGDKVDVVMSSSEASKTLMTAEQSNTALALALYRLGLLNTSERVLVAITSPSVPDWQLRAAIALAQSAPNRSLAEQDYWQALLLEPTNISLRSELLTLATALKDQSMINQVNALVAQLPTR